MEWEAVNNVCFHTTVSHTSIQRLTTAALKPLLPFPFPWQAALVNGYFAPVSATLAASLPAPPGAVSAANHSISASAMNRTSSTTASDLTQQPWAPASVLLPPLATVSALTAPLYAATVSAHTCHIATHTHACIRACHHGTEFMFAEAITMSDIESRTLATMARVEATYTVWAVRCFVGLMHTPSTRMPPHITTPLVPSHTH